MKKLILFLGGILVCAGLSAQIIAPKGVKFQGGTSGYVLVQPPAVAGTNTQLWQAATGTIALTSDVATKVNIADSATMLSPYARKKSPVFTGSVTVPTPQLGTDAANKAYVDLQLTLGVIWVAPVEDIVATLPNGIPLNQRYIKSTDNHVWTSDGDNTWTDLGGTVTGTACYVKADVGSPTNSVGQYNYNGSSWVYIGASANHNDLLNQQGGGATERYHLTAAQHTIATQTATGSRDGYLTGSDFTYFNTAYGWGNHASAGYALSSSLSGYVPTSRTVNGRALSENISVTTTDLGLQNVTNESKATMFTSPTFTTSATLPSNTSIGSVSSTEIGYVDGVTSAIQTQFTGKVNVSDTATMLTKYARKKSPTFTGVPAAPTAIAGTNTTQIATTAFAKAIGDLKVNISDTATMLTKYARKKSPTFTGTVTGTFSGNLTGNASTVTGFTPASGSLTLSGADALTLTTSNTTNVTLPTSGLLVNKQGLTDVIDSLLSVATPAPELSGGHTMTITTTGNTTVTTPTSGKLVNEQAWSDKIDSTLAAAEEAVALADLNSLIFSRDKIYNVIDYGADSTGLSYSTTAIQNCINAAGNGTVYIPSGTYVVTTLNITTAVKIVGSGWSLRSTTGMKRGTVLKSITANPIFNIENLAGQIYGDGISISDIALYGNATADNGSLKQTGILINTEANILISRVWFFLMGDYGVRMGGSDHTTKIEISNCRFTNNTKGGIYGRITDTDQINAIHITSNEINDNRGYGVNVLGTNVIIRENIIQDNDSSGIFLSAVDLGNISTSSTNTLIDANWIEENRGGNIVIETYYDDDPYVYQTHNGIEISNNTFIANLSTIETWGVKACINIKRGIGSAVITSQVTNLNIRNNNYYFAINGALWVNGGSAETGTEAQKYVSSILDFSSTIEIPNTTTAPSLVVNTGRASIKKDGIVIESFQVPSQSITAVGGIQQRDIHSNILAYLGSAIDITANPQIADGFDGQKIVIVGYSDTNTLQLDDGTGLQLAGGASITLGLGDTIELIYVKFLDLWVEVSRSDN